MFRKLNTVVLILGISFFFGNQAIADNENFEHTIQKQTLNEQSQGFIRCNQRLSSNLKDIIYYGPGDTCPDGNPPCCLTTPEKIICSCSVCPEG